jgi:hypothetical protein
MKESIGFNPGNRVPSDYTQGVDIANVYGKSKISILTYSRNLALRN